MKCLVLSSWTISGSLPLNTRLRKHCNSSGRGSLASFLTSSTVGGQVISFDFLNAVRMESRRYFVVSFKWSLEGSKYEAATASTIDIFELKINQNETHPFHSVLEKAISFDILGSFSNLFFSFCDRKSLFGWFCSSSSLIYIFLAALTTVTLCDQLLCASEWWILFQNMLQHVLSTSLLGYWLPLHFSIDDIL